MSRIGKGIKTAIFGLNDDAKAYYVELKAILEDGRFKSGDERGLARLCYYYSVLDKLEEEVNNAWGQTLPKTNIPLHDKISKTVLMMETAFQLNPTSRSKLKMKSEKKGKAFDMKVDKPKIPTTTTNRLLG